MVRVRLFFGFFFSSCQRASKQLSKKNLFNESHKTPRSADYAIRVVEPQSHMLTLGSIRVVEPQSHMLTLGSAMHMLTEWIRIQAPAGWNLQHFFFYFLLFSELSVTIWTNICGMPLCLPQGRALRRRGVWLSTFRRASQWANCHWHGRLLYIFFLSLTRTTTLYLFLLRDTPQKIQIEG